MSKRSLLEKCKHVSHAGRARTAMTCDLPKGHVGWHKAGYVSWPNDGHCEGTNG